MGAHRLQDLPTRELDGGRRVAVAATRAARLRGLGGLDDLPAGLALHLPRCRSVHTITMRLPLDLIWLAADGSVVRIDADVPPRRFKSCLRARSVVECRAGAAGSFVDAGLEGLRLR